jgi:DNA-3-methyladenine glycosylase
LNRRNSHQQREPSVMDCVLPAAFFQRPADKVARDLLGKHLVRMSGAMQTTSVIFETEAYEGAHDLASHSSRGRTPRTEVMFGPAGSFYVYRVYGLYWMLNIVTGEVGDAAAVLIRGIEGTSGPGRVAAALGIDGSFNGCEAAPATGLWFEEPERRPRKSRISRTARVGVDYAGAIWPLRSCASCSDSCMSDLGIAQHRRAKAATNWLGQEVRIGNTCVVPDWPSRP